MIKKIKISGFTLIELLVVISIIATLTAILLPNFMGAREKARDAQRKEDLYAIKTALRMYYNDTQNYPADINQLMQVVPTYSPAIGSTFFNYSSPGVHDSFVMTFVMDAGSSLDSVESQLKCNLTPTPSVFALCAN